MEHLEFIWLPTFDRTAEALLDQEQLRALELDILEAPDRGTVIRGSGGFRKLRVPAKGRGKSGGGRVIYFHVPTRREVYMILAYGKGQKATLSDAELRELRKLASIIKKGG
ncbi:MAG: type II toxin-antitoxin system RelE/ParE family toxin [Longimicrobiales bacterium]